MDEDWEEKCKEFIEIRVSELNETVGFNLWIVRNVCIFNIFFLGFRVTGRRNWEREREERENR